MIPIPSPSSQDLYLPRKCSWTNRLLIAGDHASVQLNVGNVDPVSGTFTGKSDVYALAGFVRRMGEADEALLALVNKADDRGNM
ncbi:unnamed protein product [Chrysoparadoxa australica]